MTQVAWLIKAGKEYFMEHNEVIMSVSGTGWQREEEGKEEGRRW